jgi:hypothetical protein
VVVVVVISGVEFSDGMEKGACSRGVRGCLFVRRHLRTSLLSLQSSANGRELCFVITLSK